MFYHGWIRASDCVCRGVWSWPEWIFGFTVRHIIQISIEPMADIKKTKVLTLSVSRGRSVNALQRRHRGPELLSQSRYRENIQSVRLRLSFSHPGGQIYNGYWVGMSRKILTFAFSSATSFCNDSISSMKMTWQHQFGKKAFFGQDVLYLSRIGDELGVWGDVSHQANCVPVDLFHKGPHIEVV